jgi:hypothetical protein
VHGDPFYGLGEGVLFFGLLALLLAGFEIGYRLGPRWSGGTGDATSSQITTLQSAILGMLGLLLGFSFSMSASRFDARKQLVLDEANAIGTAYLRSQLLKPPRRAEMSALFRRYVDSRLVVLRPRLSQADLEGVITEARSPTACCCNRSTR